MNVFMSIALIVVSIIICRKLFTIGNGFVDAFVAAHREIEEEAQSNPGAYEIKFYSPNNY